MPDGFQQGRQYIIPDRLPKGKSLMRCPTTPAPFNPWGDMEKVQEFLAESTTLVVEDCGPGCVEYWGRKENISEKAVEVERTEVWLDVTDLEYGEDTKSLTCRRYCDDIDEDMEVTWRVQEVLNIGGRFLAHLRCEDAEVA